MHGVGVKVRLRMEKIPAGLSKEEEFWEEYWDEDYYRT